MQISGRKQTEQGWLLFWQQIWGIRSDLLKEHREAIWSTVSTMGGWRGTRGDQAFLNRDVLCQFCWGWQLLAKGMTSKNAGYAQFLLEQRGALCNAPEPYVTSLEIPPCAPLPASVGVWEHVRSECCHSHQDSVHHGFQEPDFHELVSSNLISISREVLHLRIVS